MVLVHRFWPEDGPLQRFASLAELGWIGVDLFFVISGFLIAGILLDTKDDPRYFRNFYARRMLRIFPLYYLFVGGVLLVFPLLQGGPYMDTPFIQSAGSPAWYLLYLGNVPETIGYDPPYFLAPVWSLAIEEQFYIVFPFLVTVLDRARLKRLLVALVLLAPLLRAMAWLIAPENERIQYLATPCRMDAISVGCLLALLFRTVETLPQPATLRRALWGLLALGGLAFVLGGLSRTTVVGRIGGYSLVAVTFGVAVAYVVSRRDTAAVAWLRSRPITYLGKICYGTYLLHRPADFLVDRVAERTFVAGAAAGELGPRWAWFFASGLIVVKFALAITLASLSWYLFESRVLRLKRAFEPQGHPTHAAGAGPAPIARTALAPDGVPAAVRGPSMAP